MILSGLFFACSSPNPGMVAEESSGPSRVELSPADSVAAADLDGDGQDEWLLVVNGLLTWPGGEQNLGAAVHRVARGDLDGDGREEALLGVGMSRDYRQAASALWVVSAEGAAQVWTNAGPRSQVTDLRVIGGRVFLAHFEDRFTVTGGWLEGGVLTAVHQGRLATQQLPMTEGVVAGRVYGEEPLSDGDLVLHGVDGSRELPSLRGVRGLATADLDEDGDADLLVGDGWHYAYAEQATARVQVLEGPSWRDSRTVGFFPGDYSVDTLEVKDGWILATGAREVHLLRLDALGWADSLVATVSEGGNAVFFRTDKGLGVLSSGSPARIDHPSR